MQSAVDINWLSLGFCFLLLVIPFAISAIFRLKLLVPALIGIGRMTAQLILIGFFLGYIFNLNRPWITLVWFILMVGTATGTVIRKSDLNVRLLMVPAFFSFLFTALVVLLFFNGVVVGLERVFEAKYFIALGGMLLGNSLRGNIVGLSTFYKGIKRNENRYQYSLSLGAARMEGILPYFRKSLQEALGPTIATVATMGIVSLPGMMTGQLLGGSGPMTAVKYQIAIMIAIFAAVTMSTALSILLTLRFTFNEAGMLKEDTFRALPGTSLRAPFRKAKPKTGRG